jgi:hypothetical protein
VRIENNEPRRVKSDVCVLGKDVKEQAQYLMSLPPVPELDLSEGMVGAPARRLITKLEKDD